MVFKDTSYQPPMLSSAGSFNRLSNISFTRAPLTSAHLFYRSRVLTADIDINPLVAAAAAIFPLLHQLTETLSYNDLSNLQQMLVHEIKAFEIRAQTMGCSTDKILIARFLLCAAIDEAITTTPWGKHIWEPYKLLIHFHYQAHADEQFFLLLQRLAENIAQHLELLEFIYICFSFGYQGKYRLKHNGQEEIAKIIEELYQKIKWQRGELHKNLLMTDQVLSNDEEIDKTNLPIGLIITFFIATLLTTYMSFNFLLTQQAKSLSQPLNKLLSLFY